jgi:hypothetical protein
MIFFGKPASTFPDHALVVVGQHHPKAASPMMTAAAMNAALLPMGPAPQFKFRRQTGWTGAGCIFG